jgi:hypothetical protein
MDASPFFSDVTAAVGVDFTHRSSTWLGEFRHKQLKTPPTFSGGGVAAEDVDGDSDIDLLFVGGAGNALLLNDGRGAFSNATREAGIEWLRADGSHAEARNPIIADFDNDGRQDILITYANDDNRLYRNVGGARFEDAMRDSGVRGSSRGRWRSSTSILTVFSTSTSATTATTFTARFRSPLATAKTRCRTGYCAIWGACASRT